MLTGRRGRAWPGGDSRRQRRMIGGGLARQRALDDRRHPRVLDAIRASCALASQHRSGQGVRVPAELCFICEKHRSSERDGYSIFENDLVYAGHIHGSENEIYIGHVVVEPKRHVEGLAALTAEEAAAIGQAVSNLAEAMRTTEGVTQVSSFVFGDGSERHLHVHVVPRYPATPDDFHLLRVLEWPGAPRGGADEVRDFCARLRVALPTAR